MSDKVFRVKPHGEVHYYVRGRSFYDVRSYIRTGWPHVKDDAFTLIDAAPEGVAVSNAPHMLNHYELAQEHAATIRNQAYDLGYRDAIEDMRKVLGAPFSDLGITIKMRAPAKAALDHLALRLDDLLRLHAEHGERVKP